MDPVTENNWRHIWESRGEIKKLSFDEALLADGYDGPHSRLTTDSLKRAQAFYSEKNRIRQGDTVFEVGCGAGAFLYPWAADQHPIGGIDSSSNLIEMATQTFPAGKWICDDAIHLNTSEIWDHVLSFSTFFYFPDYDYASAVLQKMVLKARKSVGIYDIPDLSKKTMAEMMRKKLNGPDYEMRYRGLNHLYYEKEWWITQGKDLGVELKTFKYIIKGYENSKYRFCVSIRL